MKKNNIGKVLYFISILLILVFFIFIIMDYSKYDISYSAPFYVYIIVRSIEFLLPSLVSFIIGFILNEKN